MNYSQTGRCRLCADTKTVDQFINLQSDEVRRLKIMKKLSRLSLKVLNSTGEAVPQTVCFSCIDSLDEAFEFVSRVEAAQDKLSQITSPGNIKQEALDDDMCETKGQKNNIISTVMEEFKTVKCEPVVSKDLLNISIKFKSPSNKKIDSCYDISDQTALSWKDYRWQCAYCESSFPNIKDLKSHSIDVHECCNAYTCMDCKARNHNLDRFLTHVNSHRKYLKLSCYKCLKIFSKPSDASMHRTVHNNSIFKCSGCNDTFPNSEELARHSDALNKYFRNPATPSLLRLADNLTCVQCHKTFKNEMHLKRHLLIHSERKRVHTCDKCGKCFLTKKDLRGHMDMHEDIRPYQCQVCEERFRRRSHLLAHITIHNEEKPFCCEQCGRRFRLQSHLKTHSILHTDSFPYVCSYCHKGFRHKKVLITHLRQHTGEKPYSCEDCPRDFTNWANYNKHMKIRHGIDKAKKRLFKMIKK